MLARRRPTVITLNCPNARTTQPIPCPPTHWPNWRESTTVVCLPSSINLETVTLRYFNVFGARQNPNSQYAAVIPKFITACLQHEPLPVYGDGQQSRDFTYVDNVVHGNMLAMTAPDVAGKVINLANGSRTTLLQLIAYIETFAQQRAQVQFLPAAPWRCAALAGRCQPCQSPARL